MEYNQADEQVARMRNIAVEQVKLLQTTRGFSNTALRQLPEAVLHRVLRRLDFPDLPRAREAFRLLQERDERGVIPPNALPNAMSQLDSTRTRVTLQPLVAGLPTGRQAVPRTLLPPTAGLHGDHTGWTSIGPGNIGGRTRSIVIHPTSPPTFWAASVGGGVWRTDDDGASWEPVDDLMVNLAVCCLAMDPTNPNIIYAGTGEGFSNLDAIRGAGIFMTVDGASWKQLAATTGPHFQAVNRLAISPDGTLLLAATRQGIYRSSDSDRLNWSQSLSEGIADINFHPNDSRQAIAGGLNNGQAYYSTDGGQTWQRASHSGVWSGRVEVAYAVNNPSLAYASVQMNSGEIWRSTDGGKTYTRRNSLTVDGSPAHYLGDQGWYDNIIWAGDPTNADLVIVGGIDLWKSTDGGNTLIDISTWWDPKSAHADHHFIAAHPAFNGTTNKTVFFCNDGGIYTTDDISTVGNDPELPRVNGWTELNNTYGATQFYGGAGNVSTGTIIGGAQDNGTLRFTSVGGSEQWTPMFGGDGGYCAADPSDPNYFYGEYVFLNVHRSTDGGANAEFISGQFWDGAQWRWKPVPYRISDARNQNALFIAPFILDPNDPNRILGGGIALWRTNDAKTPNTNSAGPMWTPIKDSVGSPISAITVAQGNPDLIWVGHANGEVYKTADGTKANPIWQKVDRTGPKPLSANRYCTRITIDPKALNTVYITFGGYTTSNVWKTTDGGLEWYNLGNALPEAPVRSLVIHPRNSKFLYMGTEVGVFASEDGGLTWSPTNEGPTNCSIDELFWMGETLVCATHGRGMFKIDLSEVSSG